MQTAKGHSTPVTGEAMTPEQKAWIDLATYEDLLRRWRFAAVGDSMFVGATGQYYSQIMAEKRGTTNDNGVAASKSIGWDR